MLRILRKTISDKNKLSKSFNFIEFNILFFSLLGFAGLFLNYFHYDESLIHLKIIDFLRNASFRNPHGIEIPFGKIFYFLFSKLKDIENIFLNYHYLRLHSLCSMLGIMLIGKIILIKYLKHDKRILDYFYILIIFWFCFNSGGITSRYDALLGFIFFHNLYSIILYFEKKDLINIYLNFILSFILISYHPFFIVPSLICLPIFFFEIKRKRKKLNFIITNFFLVLSLFFITISLIVLDYFSIDAIKQIFFENKRHFEYINNVTYEVKLNLASLIENIKKEIFLQRINHLKMYNQHHFYLLTMMCLFYLIALFNIKNFNKLEKIIVIYIFLFIYLVLSPNKWAHHISHFFSILILIFLITVSKLKIFNFILNKKKFIFPFLLIALSLKFFNNLQNNYFFFKFMELNYKNYPKLFFNEKLNLQIKNINNLNNLNKNKNFIGNPEFNYLFKNLNYKGYNFKYSIVEGKKVDLIIKEKRWLEDCYKYNTFFPNTDFIFRLQKLEYIGCFKNKINK